MDFIQNCRLWSFPYGVQVESTWNLWVRVKYTYTEYSVQRHEVDQSTLIDGSPTLTEHLSMLEDITQRLE